MKHTERVLRTGRLTGTEKVGIFFEGEEKANEGDPEGYR